MKYNVNIRLPDDLGELEGKDLTLELPTNPESLVECDFKFTDKVNYSVDLGISREFLCIEEVKDFMKNFLGCGFKTEDLGYSNGGLDVVISITEPVTDLNITWVVGSEQINHEESVDSGVSKEHKD